MDDGNMYNSNSDKIRNKDTKYRHKLKILHIVSSSEISAGGTFMAASNLSDALLPLGALCHIVAQKYVKDEKLARKVETPFTIIPSLRFFNTGYSTKLKSSILRLSYDADIIHAHGVWTYHISSASYVSRIRNIPLIISPHGMLEPWIVSRGRLKKQIASILYQNSALQRTNCLHALCINEMHDLRALKLDNPIAVIPNGTNKPSKVQRVSYSDLSHRCPEILGKKLVLFLSRVHPKKGLINLLPAWKQATKNENNWHLIIAGPDERGHLKTVKKLITDLDISSSVTYVGPVANKEKAHLYSASKAFVLPSFSEGFSMSILEAMSYGIPCLYTKQCNFPEGEKSGASFIGDPTIESISFILSKFFSFTEAERLEMSNKAKLLVSRFYTWDRVAKDMYSLYLAIGKGNKMPDFVYFE